MSLSQEPSEENEQKEPETRLQEDEDNESNREDQKDKNTSMKDFLGRSQREKRTMSPLTLLKEDFSLLKEDMLKVFKDKDTRTEREDRPSSQLENTLLSSTLDLLKEDFSQFKEDVTSVFSISSSKEREKTINPLSFLKDDFNLSNVFKIGLSKERDERKEDLSNIFKIHVSKAERTEEPFKSLFRRDQKTSGKAANSRADRKTFAETSEEQMDDGVCGNNPRDGMDELEDAEVAVNVSEDKPDTTCRLSDTRERVEMISPLQAEDKEEEEEKPRETFPLTSLSDAISLFSLRDSNKDNTRNQPGGDLWSVKNFAYYLTFDPNTANSELHLTECNRKATRVWLDHRPSDHPDRFERCPQLLCREGLLDSAYWEVMWSGGADIGVTYNSISRDGDTASCLLGHNKWSWSLECSEGSYTPCHHNKRFRSCSPRPFTHRVGVYLDWSAGSLSFYCVSQDTMIHLHTFTSTFTEPLYPGFWVWAYDGSVSLCQVELDWERLLQ